MEDKIILDTGHWQLATKNRHILPFFIPMQGCTNHCVYCDQWAISGQQEGPTPNTITEAINNYSGEYIPQLAFYGGSFSALPKAQQAAYLEVGKVALEQGRISSIRISTHPDAIDEDKLDFLVSYGIKTIELGVQSFSVDVLKATGRSYSPEEAITACRLIKQAGMELGIQLMTGLPADDDTGALRSAEIACAEQADIIRIYPTLVLKNTPLAEDYAAGKYHPQTLEQAIELVAGMADIFQKADIPVIRMGLNPSPDLEAALIAGPYHPAFGHLVRCRMKRKQMESSLWDEMEKEKRKKENLGTHCALLQERVGAAICRPDGQWPPLHKGNTEKVVLCFPACDMPLVIGHNGENRAWLTEKYGGRIELRVDDSLAKGELVVRLVCAQSSARRSIGTALKR